MGIFSFRGLVLGSAVLFACTVSAMATSVDYNLSVNPSTTNNPNIQNSNNNTSATTGLNGVVYGSSPYLLPIYGVTTNTAPNLNVFNSTTQSWASGSWSPSGLANTNLFGKQEGGGETGLGVAADPLGENEEFDNTSKNPQFGLLVLNIQNLKNISGLTYLQLAIGSAQSGELYTIWGSNSASCTGAGTTSAGCTSLGSATLLVSGPGGSGAVSGPFDVPNWASYNYIWVGAAVNPVTNGSGQSNILLDADISFSSTPAGTPEPATLALAGSSLIGLAFYLRKRSAKR
jgi:PEP-CTERM motif